MSQYPIAESVVHRLLAIGRVSSPSCLPGPSPRRVSRKSDATFNLGMAFATAQVAPPGVYIAMSGQVFRADKVRKDHAAGRFVPLEA